MARSNTCLPNAQNARGIRTACAFLQLEIADENACGTAFEELFQEEMTAR